MPQITVASVEETRSFGERVAAKAALGDVFALEGDLGTGKTEFVRGFMHKLAPAVIVRSPSFSIVNIYETPAMPVYHFDFYRLSDQSELIEIGFDDYLAGNGICIIEWATMFPGALPAATRSIRFTDRGSTEREINYDFEV